jgi:hypothetical protein
MLSCATFILCSILAFVHADPQKETIPYVGNNTCRVPTTISDLLLPLGTWYLYQHQPDFVEGVITAGCKCTRSVLTPPKQMENLMEISNVCNYFSTSGPVVPVSGSIKAQTDEATSNGNYNFFLNGQKQNYQVLDITDDGQYMLAAVCSNAKPSISLRSFCVYYFGREKPNGKQMDERVLERFTAKAKSVGLYKPNNMRLDYIGTEKCSF